MDIRDAFFGELFNIASKDKNVIILTADMGFNEFQKFRELKGRFYNVGISEQNMISMAAGLALEGKKVYCYSIIPFLVYRAFEQIKIDICANQLPVVLIGGCAGLSNATDGHTHYGINDISLMRTLDIEILNPNESELAEFCVFRSYKTNAPVYIRLDKGDFLHYPEYITDDKIVIIATGNMVERALEIPKVRVVNLVQLKPLNDGWLKYSMQKTSLIVTLEEHSPDGLGSIISEFLHDNNLNIPLKRLGVTKTSPIGSREYMQKLNGLDVESIKREICNWV